MTKKILPTILAIVLAFLPLRYVIGTALGVREQIFEGENADEYFGIKNVNNNPIEYTGYSGKGFADYSGGHRFLRWSFVQWDIKTSFEWSDFDISVRYSSIGRNRCHLIVDGMRKGNYYMESTGSWNAWEDSMPISVSLEEGIHKIKIALIGTGGPYIDLLRIRASSKIATVDEEEDKEESTVTKDDNFITAEELQGKKEEGESNKNSSNILKHDMKLSRGEFLSSLNGLYRMELTDSTGELIIKSNSQNTIIWSNGMSGGENIFMQADGNLVVRNSEFNSVWNTGSSGHNGAQLAINDNGIASVVLNSIEIWNTRESSGTRYDGDPHSSSSSSSSSIYSNDDPQADSNPNVRKFAEKIVLSSFGRIRRGTFVSSPSNIYRIGLNDAGNFILQDSSDQTTIWNANVRGGDTATMQQDGNLVLRDENKRLIWTTHTSNNPGARLIIDDGGRLSIMIGQTSIWMEGIPRGVYNGKSSSPSLQFPLRGIFYYAWYPETWSVDSKPVKFVPDLGKYSSGDESIVKEHVDALEYAYSDVAIASWWGPGKSQELSRLTLLMDKTFEMKSSMKWTIYYEKEMFQNPSVEEIRSDLTYLQKWFVWHPSWAFIDGRPVIFVYNEAGCSVNERLKEATRDDWYVVMKVFPGREGCKIKPDSYHQYGPSSSYIHIEGVSSSVSPGFWRADQETAKLPRLSRKEFCENTKKMVASGENWQLITTFNEAGEGTLVEASSANWGSDSKYGYYLDCLHENH